MAYCSQNLSVVIIYHAGTPQDTSGTALDSQGQLTGDLDPSCFWITVISIYELLFSPTNHIW